MGTARTAVKAVHAWWVTGLSEGGTPAILLTMQPGRSTPSLPPRNRSCRALADQGLYIAQESTSTGCCTKAGPVATDGAGPACRKEPRSVPRPGGRDRPKCALVAWGHHPILPTPGARRCGLLLYLVFDVWSPQVVALGRGRARKTRKDRC